MASKMRKQRRHSVRRQLSGGRTYVYCHYCGAHAPFYLMTLDHVVPRSAGGSNALENLVLCCRKCNGAKKNLSYDEFRATLRHEVRP